MSRPSESFSTFIVDQLHELGHVECRAMFGGHGLYCQDRFFGILYKGRLYFKTDADNRRPYLEQGMRPFRPNATQTLKNYYEVPADIIDSTEQLTAWARRAMASQVRSTQQVPATTTHRRHSHRVAR